MNETHQLASAMLGIAFAAVMLVVGQLYIENKPLTRTLLPKAECAIDRALAVKRLRLVPSRHEGSGSSIGIHNSGGGCTPAERRRETKADRLSSRMKLIGAFSASPMAFGPANERPPESRRRKE
jgi:hypothetical protein